MISPHFSTSDAPSAPASEPPSSLPLRATVVAAASGFALAATLPGLLDGGLGVWLMPAILAPLVTLLGLLLPRSEVVPALLLVVAPVLVALSLAWPGMGAPSAPAMAMIALTWIVYAGLALRVLRAVPSWDLSHHPVVDSLPKERGRQQVARQIYWTTLGLGAVTLALVVPMLGSDTAYREAWGEAGGAARVLVAVVGGAVAVVAVAAIVAPGLRQKPAESTHTLRRTLVRALLYLVAAAAFAGVAWAITRARL